MRLSLWLKGSLSTPDGAAAPAGVAIEALVTDCRNRQTCPVGSTVTAADGGFELRVDAEVDAQMGRMPGESSALFVQARNGGDLVATANVCWVEDLPAGRAVELALVAARAIALPAAEEPQRPAETNPRTLAIPEVAPRTLPGSPAIEALRWA